MLFDVVHVDEHRAVLRITYRSESWSDQPSGRTPQYEVRLDEIVTGRENLLHLFEHLVRWNVHHAPFKVDLSTDRDQLCRVSLGPSRELISSRDSPAFRFDYGAIPTLSISLSYVVDQSCIGIAREQLADVLRLKN